MKRDFRLGDALVAAGLITPADLDLALSDQAEQGGLLGRHIILRGLVTRREMFGALAESWDAPLIDLMADPPDHSLLSRGDPRLLIDRGWVPWSLEAGTLTIATSVPPVPALLVAAAEQYGATEVLVRTTTDWDVFQAVSEACREDLLQLSGEELAETQPEVSASTGFRRWQILVPTLMVGALGAIAIWDIRLATIVALTLANLAFAVSIAFKVIASQRYPYRVVRTARWETEIARERERRGLQMRWRGRIDERDLPSYTILIPAYRESEVIAKVLANLEELDYPKSKLQVLVLLEEDDSETLASARAAK
ncbi:MAG: family 2 glycosyl transferase, partial [Actinobacteria bacterium]|nr:family 2 glycosyl transferase [Actinomycetota bacterium]